MATELTAVLSADSSQLQKALNDAKSTLKKYKDEASGITNVSNQQVESFNRSVNALNKLTNSSKTHGQQMSGLKRQILELSTQYNALSAEVRNSDFGRALASTLEQANSRFNELKRTAADVKTQLGETGKEGNGAKDIFDKLSGAVGVNIGTLTKFGSIAGIATGAVSVFKESLRATQGTSDALDVAQAQLTTTVNQFYKALSSGDFSYFLQGLTQIKIKAKEAQQATDDLYNVMLSHNFITAKAQTKISQARLTLYDPKATAEEKKQAQKEIEQAQKEIIRSSDNAVKAIYDKVQKNVQKDLPVGKANTAVIDKVLSVDSNADRAKYRAQYEKNYKQFQKERKKIEEKYKNYTDGRIYKTDAYNKEMTALTSKYNESIVGHTLLSSYKDDELQTVSDGMIQAERTKQEMYNTQSAALKVDQRIEKSLKSVTATAKGGKVTNNTVSENQKAIDKFEKSIANIKALTADGLLSTKDSALETLKAQKELLTSIQKNWSSATEAEKEYYYQILKDKNEALKTDKVSSVSVYQTKPIEFKPLQKVDTQIDTIEEYDNAIKKLTEDIAKLTIGSDAYKTVLAQIQKLQEGKDSAIAKAGEETEGLSKKTLGAADAVGQMGGALSSLGSSLELPELNVVGVMAQAIANMVLSYSQAVTQAASLGPWAWIGFGATGLAELATMISTVKSIGTYADGGIIKGAVSVGDFNVARVNGGEMILNGTQQQKLFNLLNSSGGYSGGINGGYVDFKINGSTLVGVLNNYNKKHSRL